LIETQIDLTPALTDDLGQMIVVIETTTLLPKLRRRTQIA